MESVINISSIQIQFNHISIEASLNLPTNAKALVIIVDENDDSGHDKNTRLIARELNNEGIATLFLDLLRKEEKRERTSRFKIRTLSMRLMKVTLWVMRQPRLRSLPMGYLALGIGGDIALRSSVIADGRMKAILCLNPLPDLASEVLPFVKIPTLFVLTGADKHVMRTNNHAYSLLECEKAIEIVNDSSPSLSVVAKQKKVEEICVNWFKKYLVLSPVSEKNG